MTQAEEMAKRFHDDGTCWFDDTGTSMDEACQAEHFSRVERAAGEVQWRCWDNSAIIAMGGAWDIKHPDCTCGWCWAGECPHCDDSDS